LNIGKRVDNANMNKVQELKKLSLKKLASDPSLTAYAAVEIVWNQYKS